MPNNMGGREIPTQPHRTCSVIVYPPHTASCRPTHHSAPHLLSRCAACRSSLLRRRAFCRDASLKAPPVAARHAAPRMLPHIAFWCTARLAAWCHLPRRVSCGVVSCSAPSAPRVFRPPVFCRAARVASSFLLPRRSFYGVVGFAVLCIFLRRHSTHYNNVPSPLLLCHHASSSFCLPSWFTLLYAADIS